MRNLAVVLALLLPAPATAETRRLGLAEALELAVSHSPELLAARAAARAASARAEGAARLTWPRLEAAAEGGWTSTPAGVFAWKLNRGAFRAEDFALERLNDPAGTGQLTTSLVATVPLDAFGRLAALRGAARADARGQGALAEEALQEVKLRVAEAWHGARLAGQALGVAERALGAARARETDLQSAVEVGAALQADLLRARARRRLREAEVESARGEQQAALAGLRRATGSGPAEAIEPEAGPLPAAELEGGVEAWTARALARRAQVAAAQARREAAEAAQRAERLGARPEIGLQARLLDDRGPGGGQVSAALGAAVRLSLFDGGRGPRRAGAAAEAEAAAQLARAAAEQVRLEVHAAWARAQAAARRRDAAAGSAEEAQEALRVVRERRQAAMATLTDELETEAAALLAELSEAQAASAAAMELARLRRAAGEL